MILRVESKTDGCFPIFRTVVDLVYTAPEEASRCSSLEFVFKKINPKKHLKQENAPIISGDGLTN